MAGERPKIIRSAEAKQSAERALVAKKKMALFGGSGGANRRGKRILFVRQSDDWVVTCGTQCRIDGADGGSD